MALGAISRKLLGAVVRVGCLGEIRGMTTVAGIGCAIIITVVTRSTIRRYSSVRPVQCIIIAVNRESCRLPTRPCGMAHRAIRRNIQGGVVRIGASVKIGGVTTRTGIGGVGIIPMVTSGAVTGDLRMRTGQRIHCIVIKSSRRPGGLAVTGCTIHGELRGGVVRIGGRIVIGRMTPCTGIGRVVVIPVVTGSTIVGNLRMRSVQGVIIVVDRKTRRRPARVGGMAHRTICWQVQTGVAGVNTGVVIGRVAGYTLRGRACVSVCVTLVAFCAQVRAGEREPRIVVIEGIASVSGRVTSQTG